MPAMLAFMVPKMVLWIWELGVGMGIHGVVDVGMDTGVHDSVCVIVGVGKHDDVGTKDHVGAGIHGDVGIGVGVGIHDDNAVGLKVVVHSWFIAIVRVAKNLIASNMNSTTDHYSMSRSK